MSKHKEQSFETLIVQHLKHGGPMPKSLEAVLKQSQTAGEAKRKREGSALLKSRFRTISGEPGLFPRWPELRRTGPPWLSHNIPVPTPYSGSLPPLPCPPGFVSLADRNNEEGFTYGSDEDQPNLGPLVNPAPAGADPKNPCHIFSALTRSATGEVSLAAATANRSLTEGYPPQEGLFFGAEGVRVAASIWQLFYLPDLPSQGIQSLRASARLSASHVREAVIGLPGGSAAGVYGIATINFFFGLFGFTAKASNWLEFLVMDQSANPLGSRNISEFDDFGYADASTVLKYDGSSVVMFVQVEFEICCATVIGIDDGAAAAVDLRFGNDDRLVVFPDGISGNAPDNPSCPLRVVEIALCGSR
jgi:hypothetical protein